MHRPGHIDDTSSGTLHLNAPAPLWGTIRILKNITLQDALGAALATPDKSKRLEHAFSQNASNEIIPFYNSNGIALEPGDIVGYEVKLIGKNPNTFVIATNLIAHEHPAGTLQQIKDLSADVEALAKNSRPMVKGASSVVVKTDDAKHVVEGLGYSV